MSNKLLTPLLTSARGSALSRAQVVEIEKELQLYHPEVYFETTFVTTIGDRDQKTSLRTLAKTDFFTKDIDERILQGHGRIGIHSAKDLPEPIPDGLSIIAVTRGVDTSDSLVIPAGETIESLKKGAVIATSSERREDCVRQLRDDFQFIDIRGTIHQRLARLESEDVQGVVIAEAALIRLGLTHLNRVKLPGETTLGQGQLAVVGRENDHEIQELFSCIDSRKKCLYVGLKTPKNDLLRRYIHAPLIKIVPKEIDMVPDVSSFTHFIFTSKSGVDLFFKLIPPEIIKNKFIISVGRKTTQSLNHQGLEVHLTAKNECSEGIVNELKSLDLKDAKVFWPHSALSRSVISDYLENEGVSFQEWILYDTHFNELSVMPDLGGIDEIFFTSPSTVDAFMHFYKELPVHITLTPIGSVTCSYLENKTKWKNHINKESSYVTQI